MWLNILKDRPLEDSSSFAWAGVKSKAVKRCATTYRSSPSALASRACWDSHNESIKKHNMNASAVSRYRERQRAPRRRLFQVYLRLPGRALSGRFQNKVGCCLNLNGGFPCEYRGDLQASR
jgi:hypothetical protein